MKMWLKTSVFAAIILILTACSTKGWNRIPQAQVDQKSFAIGYGATAQTYLNRVNQSYDIDAFMHGTDDWFNQRIKLSVSEIRDSLFNRMLDHNVYAYYSGVLYAAELQANFNRLSPTCWRFIHPASLTQGIHDAMLDLQKKQVRDDNYIKQGAEQILHLCVEQIESEQKAHK